MTKLEKSLYTLIPLDTFKALAGIDDRDEKTARFCLVTATLSIEQYCKRRFLRKKYFETIQIKNNYLVLPLKEYPVSEIMLVTAVSAASLPQDLFLIEPEFYRPMDGNNYNEEMIFELLLSPSLKKNNLIAVKVIYWAGYSLKKIPDDLSAACLELGIWNFNRYKGRRVGMSGNIRGAGTRGIHADGEHFELSMPENVKALIEPYKRKTI